MKSAAGSTQTDAHAFERRLRRAKLAIIKDAGSRTCGGCQHAVLSSGGVGFCSRYTNYEGNALEIRRSNAYACRDGFVPADS